MHSWLTTIYSGTYHHFLSNDWIARMCNRIMFLCEYSYRIFLILVIECSSWSNAMVPVVGIVFSRYHWIEVPCLLGLHDVLPERIACSILGYSVFCYSQFPVIDFVGRCGLFVILPSKPSVKKNKRPHFFRPNYQQKAKNEKQRAGQHIILRPKILIRDQSI